MSAQNQNSPTYPIYLARNAWFESEEGKHCKVLAEDCLTLAFVAGWRAALAEMERQVTERALYGAANETKR